MASTCEIRVYSSESEAQEKEVEVGDYLADLELVGWRSFKPCTIQINRVVLRALEADARAYGMSLGQVFFSDQALGKPFHDMIVATQARGEAIRIRLRIEPAELLTLHWERIQAPFGREWRPLSLGAETPFSRHVRADQWGEPTPVRERPLRLVAVIASPRNLGEYGLDEIEYSERALLHKVLDSLPDVEVTYLESGTEYPPTLTQIQKALSSGCHLVHFLCHGASKEEGTVVYLEREDDGEEDGRVDPVSAERIIEAFQMPAPPDRPALCFMAVCESAKRNQYDGFVPLGPALVERGGVQAAVAMSDKVGLKTAQQFASQFYARLLVHGRVDLAVNEARALVKEEWDWSVPVLLMRTPDGQAFVPVKEEQPPALPAELREAPCPYRGLRPFEAEHAGFFFGREAMVDKLATKLGAVDFLAAVGPSGSGKSSLVRAGLIPALGRGCLPGSRDWAVLEPFRPDSDPLRSLAGTLLGHLQPDLGLADRLVEARKLADYLQEGKIPLSDLLAELRQKLPRHAYLLLVADQFEEVFTLCQDKDLRQAFVNTLLAAGETGWIKVICTLRADFLGHVLQERALGERVDRGQVNVLPMSDPERRAAIEQPALKLGRRFEPWLVERILEAVANQPGELPLLQFALEKLWAEQTDAGLLTHGGYEAIGEVKGALAQHAEEVMVRTDTDQVRMLLSRLVRVARPEEGARDTRRRMRLDEFDQDLQHLARQLSDERLLVTGRDAVTHAETIEVAHEALIQHWPRLRGWLDEDRQLLVVLDEIGQEARSWNAHGQDDSYLRRGSRLAEVQKLRGHPRFVLTDLERKYLESCVALHEREQEQVRLLAELEFRRQAAEREREEERARREFIEQFADLEIRIMPRAEEGYLVDIALDKTERFPRGHLDRDVLTWVPSASLEEDGQRINHWLLADSQLRHAWTETSVVHRKRRIRLRIDAKATELAPLPWEALREELEGELSAVLSAAESTPFSRYIPRAKGLWVGNFRPPLRMVVVIANPDELERYGLPPIDVAAEWSLLQEATADLDLEVAMLRPPCTLEALASAVRDDCHILHLIGHSFGKWLAGAYMPALYLADEGNQTRPVQGSDLAGMLAHQMDTSDAQLRLVFLDRPNVPSSQPADAAIGFAPRLIGAGVPAVLAMGSLLAWETRFEFQRTFYRELLGHGLVDLAANAARGAILTAGQAAGSLPVLTSVLEDGELFTLRELKDSTFPAKDQAAQPVKAFDTVDIHIHAPQSGGYPLDMVLSGERSYQQQGLLSIEDARNLQVYGDPFEQGQELFQALTGDEQMKISWSVIRALSRQFHLRLHISGRAPELQTLAWEGLSDTTTSPATTLAASSATPFSRYLNYGGSQENKAQLRPIAEEPVRMLVAITNPENRGDYHLRPLDVHREEAELRAALQGLPVEATFLGAPCSLSSLEAELQKGYHLLHVISHARSLKADSEPDTILYLANTENRVAPTRGIEFAEMVARSRSDALRFIFLAGAETAPLAVLLVTADVPAALAMRGEFSLVGLHTFSSRFYRQLFRHGLLDLACNEARSSLITRGRWDFDIPVLFSRMPENRLIER